MAEKAKRTKKPVTIGQMNAHDRRIVHIHLKDESGVRTQSIGEGYYRKLMIFPKKQAGSRRRQHKVKCITITDTCLVLNQVFYEQ